MIKFLFLLSTLLAFCLANKQSSFNSQQQEVKIKYSDICNNNEIGTIIFHEQDTSIIYNWFSYVPINID